MEPVIAAAWIGTAGTVFASLVGASIAGWYAKRWLRQEELRQDLATARKDIEYLLEVEKRYVEHARGFSEMPGKQTVRREVNERGLKWGQVLQSSIFLMKM